MLPRSAQLESLPSPVNTVKNRTTLKPNVLPTSHEDYLEMSQSTSLSISCGPSTFLGGEGIQMFVYETWALDFMSFQVSRDLYNKSDNHYGLICVLTEVQWSIQDQGGQNVR